MKIQDDFKRRAEPIVDIKGVGVVRDNHYWFIVDLETGDQLGQPKPSKQQALAYAYNRWPDGIY